MAGPPPGAPRPREGLCRASSLPSPGLQSLPGSAEGPHTLEGLLGVFRAQGTWQVSPDLSPWADAEPQVRQAPHRPSQVRASGLAGHSLARDAGG